jgi:hypothetical protein
MQKALWCIILVAAGIVTGCIASESRRTAPLGSQGTGEAEAREATIQEEPIVARAGSEDLWYSPRSKSEWQLNSVADIDSEGIYDYRPVVIVIGSFANPPHRIGGNGVVLACLGDWDRDGAPILTCAHLVSHESREALEIRVGVFDHSFEPYGHDMPEYQEFTAEIVTIDTESDLALLEIHSQIRIHGVSALEPAGTVNGRMVAISIFPYREPLQHEGHDLYFVDGNSGSPIFLEEEKLFALANGRLEAGLGEDVGLGYWSDPDAIREFLRLSGLEVRETASGSARADGNE